MTVLFLSKHKPFAEDAAALVRLHVSDAEIIFGNVGDPFPRNLLTERFDYIISYISPWIVPGQALKNTKKAAINFHPGPPEYPGIGCTNFAIYNNEREFGITIHYMNETADTGDIISVERFPIFHGDSVYSLTQRCYAYIFISFTKIFSFILSGKQLSKSKEIWKRKAFTRKELNELCRITREMQEDEVRRRVRATSYPEMPGAYIDLHGFIFQHTPDTRHPGE